jgi:hypothetical protein
MAFHATPAKRYHFQHFTRIILQLPELRAIAAVSATSKWPANRTMEFAVSVPQ